MREMLRRWLGIEQEQSQVRSNVEIVDANTRRVHANLLTLARRVRALEKRRITRLTKSK